MLTKARTMEKQWRMDPQPSALSHDWKRMPFLPEGETEGVPFSRLWQWGKVRILATPTRLQALPPHDYCKKLTLLFANIFLWTYHTCGPPTTALEVQLIFQLWREMKAMEEELHPTAGAFSEVWQAKPTKPLALVCKLIAIHSVGAPVAAVTALWTMWYIRAKLCTNTLIYG